MLQKSSNSCLLILYLLEASAPSSNAVVRLYKHVSSLVTLLPAAQFDSPAKDETPHPTLTRQPQHPPAQPQQQQHQHLRQKSWTQKILRSSPPTLLPSSSSSSSSSPDAEACCVDPSLPLEKQRWGGEVMQNSSLYINDRISLHKTWIFNTVRLNVLHVRMCLLILSRKNSNAFSQEVYMK